MIKSLAFLPTCDVNFGKLNKEIEKITKTSGFQILKNYVDDMFIDLLLYIEINYIGERRGRVRKAPLFPIESWNVRDRTLQGEARCNNSIESWHLRDQDHFISIPHPNIWQYINKTKDFIDEVYTDLCDLRQGVSFNYRNFRKNFRQRFYPWTYQVLGQERSENCRFTKFVYPREMFRISYRNGVPSGTNCLIVIIYHFYLVKKFYFIKFLYLFFFTTVKYDSSNLFKLAFNFVRSC